MGLACMVRARTAQCHDCGRGPCRLVEVDDRRAAPDTLDAQVLDAGVRGEVRIRDDDLCGERLVVPVARAEKWASSTAVCSSVTADFSASLPVHLKLVDARSCAVSHRTPWPAAQPASGPWATAAVQSKPLPRWGTRWPVR